MPSAPDYSQYIAVKKINVAQTANTNTTIIKRKAPNRFDGYFPLYSSIRLPPNALLSNKFTGSISSAPATPPIPFAPSDVVGLITWLDSSALTNGATITSWVDKSSSAITFTKTGTPNIVVSQIGGLNYMNMTAGSAGTTNSFFTTGTYNFPASYSIFAVGYTTAGNSPSPEIAGLMGAGDLTLYLRRTGNSFDAVYGNNVAWDNTPPTFGFNEGATTTPRIYEFTQDNSGIGAANLYINGVSRVSSTGNTAARSNFGLNVGARQNSQTWGGYLGEFLIFNSSISTTNRQKVEGYLAWKWNLVSDLPANHPYKTAAP